MNKLDKYIFGNLILAAIFSGFAVNYSSKFSDRDSFCLLILTCACLVMACAGLHEQHSKELTAKNAAIDSEIEKLERRLSELRKNSND